MALSAATRLGPYEILGLIGAGGMGEVYSATDTRLDRTVAIKVLPPHLSDLEHRARFEREARTIAGLSHPHICTLLDVGEYGSSLFLVMEHLSGETLSERLRSGPLPLDEALQVAIETAEALSAAHRAGVVHRDLKPGNIMLTNTGVKLLDFGLAKLAPAGEPALSSIASVATHSGPLTGRGTILGTLQYMAPEQLEGKDADARTDIWALGLVLYEMVAGRRAFEGQSEASLIAAILEKQPEPLSTRAPLIPASLDRVVRQCLEKEPDRRLQDAHDLALQLRWSVSGPQSSSRTTGDYWIRHSRVTAVLGVALLAAVAVTAKLLFVVRPSLQTPPHSVIRFVVQVPPGRALSALALSPDGSRIVYAATPHPGSDSGRRQLFVRLLSEFGDRPIANTEGATVPFFSPDGASVGFFADGHLKRLPVDGGEVVTICEARGGTPGRGEESVLSPSATWNADGTVIFSRGPTGLFRVPAAGGVPVAVTRVDAAHGELGHAWPTLLPGGDKILFSIIKGVAFGESDVALYSSSSHAYKILVANASGPRYVTSGYMVFSQGEKLMAVAFNPTDGATAGDPVPLASDVGWSGWGKDPQYSIAASGDLVYAPALPERPTTVVRVDRQGKAEAVVSLEVGFRGAVSLSPDGRRLAMYRIEGAEMTLWAVDISRGIATRVAGEGNAHAGVWSPDGRRLVFSSDRKGSANLFVQSADGSSAEQLLVSPKHGDPGSWSRDGRWIAYSEVDPGSGWDLWTFDFASHHARLFRSTAGSEQQPAIAPDGRWIAYASNEAGRFEVYVERFPESGNRTQISVDGGTEPQWSPNGRQLFFRSGQRLMAVAVQSSPTFSAERPTVVLEGTYLPPASFGPASYAVAPDGNHFYFLRADEPPHPRQINVVLGWRDELTRRLGTRTVSPSAER